MQGLHVWCICFVSKMEEVQFLSNAMNCSGHDFWQVYIDILIQHYDALPWLHYLYDVTDELVGLYSHHRFTPPTAINLDNRGLYGCEAWTIQKPHESRLQAKVTLKGDKTCVMGAEKCVFLSAGIGVRQSSDVTFEHLRIQTGYGAVYVIQTTNFRLLHVYFLRTELWIEDPFRG